VSTCTLCGQDTSHLPAMIARAKGFDPTKHCTIVANQNGILTPAMCDEVNKLGIPIRGLCENCPIGNAFGVKWSVSKGYKKSTEAKATVVIVADQNLTKEIKKDE
jgi:hypothetical protein